MSTSIFDGTGVTIAGLDSDNDITYMTMTCTSDSEDEGDTVVLAKAPSCQVNIAENANISVDRSLSGDWLVLTFGMRLVDISISGLDIYGMACEDKDSDDMTIQDIFDTYNCAVHPKARITLSMTNGKRASTVYKCILISMERIKNSLRLDASGVGEYGIRLVGVKKL